MRPAQTPRILDRLRDILPSNTDALARKIHETLAGTDQTVGIV
jgi:hypothetical protein